MLYREMDRAQLDAAYNNSAAVPERDAIVADWAARSARVRRECVGRLELAYGDTPRERLDLFLAADPKAPTLAFIHGGYWQMNDKESFVGETPSHRSLSRDRSIQAHASNDTTWLDQRLSFQPPTPQSLVDQKADRTHQAQRPHTGSGYANDQRSDQTPIRVREPFVASLICRKI